MRGPARQGQQGSGPRGGECGGRRIVAFSPGPPRPFGLRRRVNWGPGDRPRAVSCRAPEPLSLGPGLEAVANLCPMPTSATEWRWRSPWVAVRGTWPPVGRPEEPEGRLGPGRLAPSAMTPGRGLGTWPCGHRQLRSASSARLGTGGRTRAG